MFGEGGNLLNGELMGITHLICFVQTSIFKSLHHVQGKWGPEYLGPGF